MDAADTSIGDRPTRVFRFVKAVVAVVLGVVLGYRFASTAGREPYLPPGDLGVETSRSDAPGESENEAVVDAVGRGWAADRAGLRPGDVILSWSRGAENGPVRTPFELAQVEINQAPLGRVTLLGSRNGETRAWVLPPGMWSLWARPGLPRSLLALYRQGESRIAAGDFEGGTRQWRSAMEAALRQNDPLRASWIEARLGREFAGAGRWTEAEQRLEAAVRRLEPSQPAAVVQIVSEWYEREGSLPVSLLAPAEASLRRTLVLEPAESISAAWHLAVLADLAGERGDFVGAQEFHRRAYELLKKLAPRSASLISNLKGAAMAAGRLGDLERAEADLREALRLQRRLDPEGIEISILVDDLGMIAVGEGDLDAAEEHFREARREIERLSPEGLEAAQVGVNLGFVAMRRGELALAEDHLRRSLALRERLIPESFEVAQSFNYLGDLARKRGDFAAADGQYRRALAITGRIARSSAATSVTVFYYLNNLAAVQKRSGDLAGAEVSLRRAQEIEDRILPNSYEKSGTCFQRGLIAFERGDLALAEEMQTLSLAIRNRGAAGRLDASDNLEALGNIAFARGDSMKALEHYRRALSIREKLAPGTTRVAESLNHLGQVERRQKQFGPAAEHFCRATRVYDQQRKKLGGTPEGKSAFGGTTAEPYRDCVAALIDTGRTTEAFHVLEQGRARAFLDLLAQRDFSWKADLPPDLDRERKKANAEYDRTQATLEQLTPGRHQAEIDRLRLRLRDLRALQERITAKIRKSSPRIAALQDPRPLDLAGVRAVLDPGTVLLAWSIGKERSFLFVIQARGSDPGFAVVTLPNGEPELRKRVETFRKLLLRLGPRRMALAEKGRELYDLLLRPAEPWISASSRLLISPDGPLHTLPFAALVRDGHWLAEQKPIHEVLSATVYADLLKARRAGASAVSGELTAFGAPRYPPIAPGQAAAVDPEVRAAVKRGLFLTSLPGSGDEVRGIASLYPGARTFLGAAATEERAKSVPQGTRYLHFACHGLLDERFPLNSALALSIPEHPKEGEDNGLLQAWEIFESVRLDADLVTLSSCDSGLGQELGGEGLLGLTRAFQYAGARSVLASLWSVSDRSTAELMKRFYGHLRQGATKDEALRRAQVDLIRSPESEFSHPYYWAAFQLSGDWR